MSNRYFAPAFVVRVNGAKLDADISRSLTEVSVTDELDTTDQFSLTIANPYPKLRWTHTDDAGLFKEGNAVKIELGYGDDLQPMLEGEITRISPTFPESGMPMVRIEGHGLLHRLQGSRHTRTFQNMTDKQIAEKIAQEVKLTPQVEDTKTEYAYVIQCNQADLDFLKERARLIHFELFVKGKDLIFRRSKTDQSKTYTLVWGNPSRSFAPEANVLPLKSFTPTLNTLHQVNEVIVRGYDPKTKKEIVGRAGAGAEETKMGGTQTGAQISANAFGARKEEVRVQRPIASQEEADKLARAIYNQRALQFLTGSGSTIGLPDLRAGCVVDIDGLGTRFSGLYYVTQATHSIGNSGYQTTFAVRRNASS